MNTSKEIYFQRFNIGNVREKSPKNKRKSRHKDLGNLFKKLFNFDYNVSTILFL